jgi:hypothetical protein
MIRLSLAFAALFCLTLESMGAAATAKPVSRDEVADSIVAFQKDPTSTEGFAAAAAIMSFAQKSDTVHISLSKAVVPWVKSGDVSDSDTRGILLTAYVAGNVESQIKSGKKADDVYAGWEQVLATYAQLLKINSAAKISEVDELKAKDLDGSLRAYAVEAQGK